MMEDDSASFSATLYQIKTTIDGGWRITFDVPSSDAEEIMKLSKMMGSLLQLGAIKNDD